MSTISRLFLVIIVVFAFVMGAFGAPKLAYPEKPITIIIPYAPGGPVDLGTRAMMEAAKPYFPQVLVPVNKAGAAGVIGTAEWIRSAPDGYTLGSTSNSLLVFQPHLERDIPFKGPWDVQPIIGLHTSPNGLFCRPDAPWKTVKEFIEYAKANPGKLRCGTAGTSVLVEVEALKRAINVDITLVPFDGFAPALAAILGGHIELAGLSPGTAMPHAKAGKIRPLLVFSEKRLSVLPDTPTVVEIGYKTPIPTRRLIAAPKGTPKDIVEYLYNTFKKAYETEGYRKYIADNAFFIEDMSPGDWAKVLEKEHASVGKLIKELKL